MGWWRLITRMVVGFLMFGHGTQKLFGWFGGGGLAETSANMEKLGLRPGRDHAAFAGVSEATSGGLLAAGAALPVAAALVTGVMETAVKRAHLKNGIWVTKGGYEYPLVMTAAVLTLAEGGAGRFSIGRRLGLDQRGSDWAALAFGVGSLGAWVVDGLARRGLPSAIDWVEDHRPHPSLIGDQAA
jgi:putative oxidoreductase